MARLYANENFPFPAVVELRRLGHDVLTTGDVQKNNLAVTDEQVLEFAIQENRAVLTLNRKHFIRLHSSASHHLGIIVCTFDPDFMRLARRVDTAVGNVDLVGRLIRVNRPG